MNGTLRLPRLVLGSLLLPALAACSGSRDDALSGAKSDAGDSAIDGGASGSTDAAMEGDSAGDPDTSVPRGAMRFTLHYNRRPVPNAVVVLHDESGAALESLSTDAMGQVQPAVAPHMITVLPPPEFLELMEGGPISYLGVEPGDELFIDLDQIGVDNPSEGSYSVSLPGLVDTANLYFVSANSEDCGTSASSDGQLDMAFPLYTKCTRPQGIDVFAVAQRAGTGPLKFAYARDQPVPASSEVQPLMLTEWVDPDLVTLSVLNADPQIPPYASVASYRNGGRYWTGDSDGTPNGTDSWQFFTALGFFDTLAFTASFNSATSTEMVYSQLDQRTLPRSTYELDANAVLPPVRVGTIDTTHVTRPILSMEPAAAGTTDATVLSLELTLQDANDGNFFTAWTFVAPPDAAQLQLPDLSVYADHLDADLGPPTNLELRVLGAVSYDVDTVPDYGAFRRLPVDFTSYTEGQTFDVRVPTPSLLRTTSWRSDDG